MFLHGHGHRLRASAIPLLPRRLLRRAPFREAGSRSCSRIDHAALPLAGGEGLPGLRGGELQDPDRGGFRERVRWCGGGGGASRPSFSSTRRRGGGPPCRSAVYAGAQWEGKARIQESPRRDGDLQGGERVDGRPPLLGGRGIAPGDSLRRASGKPESQTTEVLRAWGPRHRDRPPREQAPMGHHRPIGHHHSMENIHGQLQGVDGGGGPDPIRGENTPPIPPSVVEMGERPPRLPRPPPCTRGPTMRRLPFLLLLPAPCCGEPVARRTPVPPEPITPLQTAASLPLPPHPLRPPPTPVHQPGGRPHTGPRVVGDHGGVRWSATSSAGIVYTPGDPRPRRLKKGRGDPDPPVASMRTCPWPPGVQGAGGVSVRRRLQFPGTGHHAWPFAPQVPDSIAPGTGFSATRKGPT